MRVWSIAGSLRALVLCLFFAPSLFCAEHCASKFLTNTVDYGTPCPYCCAGEGHQAYYVHVLLCMVQKIGRVGV